MTRLVAAGAAGLALWLTPISVIHALTDEEWHRLQPGLSVEVQGEHDPDRGFRGKKIKVREGRRAGRVEVFAPVEELDLRRRTLRVLDTEVQVVDETSIADDAGNKMLLADLAPGSWIELDARDEGDRLRARRIRLLAEPLDKIEIDGVVDDADPGRRTLTVSGLSLRLSRSAELRNPELAPLPPAIAIPRAIDDDDLRPAVRRAFGNRVGVAARVEVEVEPEGNFDLNPTRRGDLTRALWATQFQFDTQPVPTLAAFFRAGYRGRQVLIDDEGDEENNTQWQVQQLYVVWQPTLTPWAAVQIGRQDFDEAREWLYDENLDAARLYLALGKIRAEASVSTRWGTTSRRLDDWTNWMLLARREVRRRWSAEGYVIHRRLRDDRGQRPVWLGLRSHGRLRSGIDHWIELSTLRGRADGETLTAWAADVGAQVRLRRRPEINVTGGWAFGSGGRDPGDRYLQTGLHDNNDKFGGVSSLKYYGELLEPELSNLEIATAGLGVRPTRRSSVDLVFHRYRQRRAADLIASNLETRPRGVDPIIGHEWDVILAFEEIPGVDIEYVFATFVPAAAFDSRATNARFHQLSVQFNF